MSSHTPSPRLAEWHTLEADRTNAYPPGHVLRTYAQQDVASQLLAMVLRYVPEDAWRIAVEDVQTTTQKTAARHFPETEGSA